MPVTCQVKKTVYPSTNSNHAEEVMFNTKKYDTGNFTVYMNGWPCTGGHTGHDCHKLYTDKSVGRIITVIIDDDKGGYAANHGYPMGTKSAQIVYNNGGAPAYTVPAP